MVTITAIGLYKVATSPEPCWLVEIVVRGLTAPFNDHGICQPQPAVNPRHWQAAYLLRRLNESGTRCIRWAAPWTDSERMCFFIHYLDPSLPLSSRYGLFELPAESLMPTRLDLAVTYSPPD